MVDLEMFMIITRKTGVYENKDGGYKTLWFADALVKRYPLRAYCYRAVVEKSSVNW